MSRSPCRIRPAVCVSRPATMRSRVVLPQPDGPRKQTNSPFATSRSMSLSASKDPNDLRMPSRRRYSATGNGLLFRLGLRVVALGPLGEDALAVVGSGLEVHLDEALLVVGGHVGEWRGDAGLRGDREVLAVEQHCILARRPVGKLLRGVELLRPLH